MKKLLCFLLVCGILVLGACGNGDSGADRQKGNSANKAVDPVVLEAIMELQYAWELVYEENGVESDYLEIKNTRVIYLTDEAEEIWGGFENVECMVEFELYSHYYGTQAYPVNLKVMDCVIFCTDGSVEIRSNPLDLYRSSTYQTDYTHIIREIVDYGSQYDQVLDLNN